MKLRYLLGLQPHVEVAAGGSRRIERTSFRYASRRRARTPRTGKAGQHGQAAMNKHAELYACLYAKEFPAQALLRLRPELRDKPCVVMEGEPPLAACLFAQYEGAATWHEHGMTRVEVDTFLGPLYCRARPRRKRQRKLCCSNVLVDFRRVSRIEAKTTHFCAHRHCRNKKSLRSTGNVGTNSSAARAGLGIAARVAVSRISRGGVSLPRGRLPKTSGAGRSQRGRGGDALRLCRWLFSISRKSRRRPSRYGAFTRWGCWRPCRKKNLIARMGQEGKRFARLARGEMPHLFQPVEPVFTLEELHELDSPVELLDSLLFRRWRDARSADPARDGAHPCPGFRHGHAHARRRR